MGCNIPYAEVRISKVGAQLKNVKYQLLAPSRQETALQHLLGLHSWSPGEPAAEALVDVAVRALPALLPELPHAWGRLAAGVVHADVAGLAVRVLVAVLAGLLAEYREAASSDFNRETY